MNMFHDVRCMIYDVRCLDLRRLMFGFMMFDL